MPKESAGVLLYKKDGGNLRVLLAHPGGPYFTKKDDSYWSIPKGEIEPHEDPLSCAVREFREEIGFTPVAPFVSLGKIKQRGGKTVSAWAAQSPSGYEGSEAPKSALFRMEWPPKSGKEQSFPEVDRAAFFPLDDARRKILPSQESFITRLQAILSSEELHQL